MARVKRKELEIFSLSFMDCICCGFGAVILLLTLNRGIVHKVIETETIEEEKVLEKVEEEVFDVFGQIADLELQLVGVKENVAKAEESLAKTQAHRTNIQGEFANVPDHGVLIKQLEQEYQQALQELDKTRNAPKAWRTDSVGGIPADSRFLIFVIDTSGSIADRGRTVMNVLLDILAIYPRGLDGIQVVNDEGVYLAGSNGKWIPGDEAGRQRVLNGVGRALQLSTGRMRGRQLPTNSDPANGMIRALKDFRHEKQMSMYVIGDDGPNGGTARSIVREFDQLNLRDAKGKRRVRVHGIGILTPSGDKREFGTGMRFITNRYDGAFVGMTL